MTTALAKFRKGQCDSHKMLNLPHNKACVLYAIRTDAVVGAGLQCSSAASKSKCRVRV